MILSGSAGVMALVAVFLATFMLGVVLVRRPTLAVPLILVVELSQWRPNAILIVLASGFHVYFGDVVTIGVIVAFLIRFMRPKDYGANRPLGIILVFNLMLLIGITRGLGAFSPNQVLNFSRESLSLWTTMLFMSTVPVTRRVMESLRNWFTMFAVGLTTFAIHYWVTIGFGTYNNEVQGRAIDKTQALVVLTASILLFAYPFGRAWVLRFVPPAIGAAVVLLSIQKTVWLAGIVAIIVLVAASGSGQAARTRRRIVFVAGALLALVVTFAPGGVSHDLSHSVASTQGESSSVSWRTQGWSQIIRSQESGPLTSLLIGSPIGTVFDRSIYLVDSNNRFVQTSVDTRAHSDYVQQFAEIGVVGLVLFVLFLFWLVRGTWRITRETGAEDALTANVLLSLLLGCMAFYLAYTNADISGITIGLCASLVGSHAGKSSRLTPGTMAQKSNYSLVGPLAGQSEAS